MLGINRHTDYATRIVLHLATLDEGVHVTAADIAAQGLLPAPFIRRVIAQLANAGIVRTIRGSRGGVTLARPASEISLLDILRAMEGGVVLNACVGAPHACTNSGLCPARIAWAGATRAMEDQLRSVHFADLARSAAAATRRQPGTGAKRTTPPRTETAKPAAKRAVRKRV